MNCPKCGKPVAGAASFCMHCGAMFASAPRPTGQPAYSVPAYSPSLATVPDAIRRRNTVLAIVISIVVIALVFAGLNATGVLRFGAKQTDTSSLQAQGAVPPSTLQSRGTGPDPTLHSTRKTMPKPIRDWLEHLARIERRKQALGSKQVEQMQLLKSTLTGAGGLTSPEDVESMTDPDYNSFPSIEKAAAMITELKPDWEQLVKDFDSYPPPPECQEIANQYGGAMDSIISTIDKVLNIVESVNLTSQGDIKGSAEEVRGVGRGHRRGIDGNFERADDLVKEVCDKYETPKWFKIDAHGGSAGLLGH